MARATREKSASPARGRGRRAAKPISKSPAPPTPRAKTPQRAASKTPAKKSVSKPAPAPRSPSSEPETAPAPKVSAPTPRKVKEETAAPATARVQTDVSTSRTTQLFAFVGMTAALGWLTYHTVYTETEQQTILNANFVSVLAAVPVALFGLQAYSTATERNRLFPLNAACFVLLYFIAEVTRMLLPAMCPECTKEYTPFLFFAARFFLLAAAHQADSDGVNAPFGLSIAVISATLAVQAGLQGFDTLKDTYYSGFTMEVIGNCLTLIATALAIARAANAASSNSSQKDRYVAAAIGIFLWSNFSHVLQAYFVTAAQSLKPGFNHTELVAEQLVFWAAAYFLYSSV